MTGSAYLELDDDVVEAAKKRIRRTYEVCDWVIVYVSGGKDSTAVHNGTVPGVTPQPGLSDSAALDEFVEALAGSDETFAYSVLEQTLGDEPRAIIVALRSALVLHAVGLPLFVDARESGTYVSSYGLDFESHERIVGTGVIAL